MLFRSAFVNEWIRHADAKTGVTLAFTAALATVVFNLSKDFHHRTTIFDFLVAFTSVLLVLTAALCGWTLTPRVNDRDADPESINRLYFGSITDHFRGKRPQYSEALSTLAVDPSELILDLSAQIHANGRLRQSRRGPQSGRYVQR